MSILAQAALAAGISGTIGGVIGSLLAIWLFG